MRTIDKMDSSFKGRLPVILQRHVLIPQLIQLSIANIEVLRNKPWSVRVADKQSVFEPSLSVRARFVRFQKQAKVVGKITENTNCIAEHIHRRKHNKANELTFEFTFDK